MNIKGVGTILSFFGLPKRVDRVEAEMEDIRHNVRYEVTCDKIVEGIGKQFKSIQDLQKETRDDIKELLRR